MHTCPECGQACYCHGDIDDSEVEDPQFAYENCTHYLTPGCSGGDAGDDENEGSFGERPLR